MYFSKDCRIRLLTSTLKIIGHIGIINLLGAYNVMIPKLLIEGKKCETFQRILIFNCKSLAVALKFFCDVLLVQGFANLIQVICE